MPARTNDLANIYQTRFKNKVVTKWFDPFLTLDKTQVQTDIWLDFGQFGPSHLIRNPSKTTFKAPFKNRFFGIRYPYLILRAGQSQSMIVCDPL